MVRQQDKGVRINIARQGEWPIQREGRPAGRDRYRDGDEGFQDNAEERRAKERDVIREVEYVMKETIQ